MRREGGGQDRYERQAGRTRFGGQETVERGEPRGGGSGPHLGVGVDGGDPPEMEPRRRKGQVWVEISSKVSPKMANFK